MIKTFITSTHIEPVIDNFKGVLLDAYGVFWDGSTGALFPGARDTMARLVSRGKIVGILSNSSVLGAREIAKLQKHGLTQGEHFHFLLTSGEVAREALLEEKLPFPTPSKKFWILGNPHPRFFSARALFANTPYSEVDIPDTADFIYIDIPHINGEDQYEVACFRDVVAQIVPLKLPMLCTNTDKFAHEANKPLPVIRQGSIAAMYEEMGGTVIYFGKPSPLAYQVAMHHFQRHGAKHTHEIVMIGDTPETDIRGAYHSGLASALLLETGIMAHRIADKGLESAIQSLSTEDTPTYFVGRFSP